MGDLPHRSPGPLTLTRRSPAGGAPGMVRSLAAGVGSTARPSAGMAMVRALPGGLPPAPARVSPQSPGWPSVEHDPRRSSRRPAGTRHFHSGHRRASERRAQYRRHPMTMGLLRWARCPVDRQLHLLTPAQIQVAGVQDHGRASCGRLVLRAGLTINGAPVTGWCTSCLTAGTASKRASETDRTRGKYWIFPSHADAHIPARRATGDRERS